ncbi:type III secretion system needle filament subunit SctF [Aeromonas veronii]|uniref:type III secretion system needle filament subunit SctF n=1 Tax=Aeromonas veronii TaxID=654 RepID=UPI001A8DA989|nr:type III secretion system needle filament subunit SctF [Aeromonas veronii]MBO0398020.1 type III secretion system needle filament subunit SctF [Aeromonas veronii]MCF5849245.1 type III secretion system needle filament subunit SctF [Aeromonas veronii]MCX9105641.1 type III secretion system needle filament subunit SctF [Aeromonas veronii]MCX9121278.1 type III secretion system needle filament subunit SctF [Aeromonas veronii]
MADYFKYADGTTNTLDQVASNLSGQANIANEDVNKAIAAMEKNPDNPALLAELQHKINKWSVIYNINSTVTRAMKDLMQGILQKI